MILLALEKKIRIHGKKLVKIGKYSANLQFNDFFRENDEFYYSHCDQIQKKVHPGK